MSGNGSGLAGRPPVGVDVTRCGGSPETSCDSAAALASVTPAAGRRSNAVNRNHAATRLTKFVLITSLALGLAATAVAVKTHAVQQGVGAMFLLWDMTRDDAYPVKDVKALLPPGSSVLFSENRDFAVTDDSATASRIMVVGGSRGETPEAFRRAVSEAFTKDGWELSEKYTQTGRHHLSIAEYREYVELNSNHSDTLPAADSEGEIVEADYKGEFFARMERAVETASGPLVVVSIFTVKT